MTKVTATEMPIATDTSGLEGCFSGITVPIKRRWDTLLFLRSK